MSNGKKPTAQQKAQKKKEWFARNKQAEALEREGKTSEALRLYEQNAREGCDVRFTYDRLAVIYRGMERHEDELEALQTAHRIEKQRGPSDRLVRLEQQMEVTEELRDRARRAGRAGAPKTRQTGLDAPVRSAPAPAKSGSKGCLSVVALFALVGGLIAALF